MLHLHGKLSASAGLLRMRVPVRASAGNGSYRDELVEEMFPEGGDRMSVIMEMAKDLGQAMRETEEFEKLKAAEQKLNEDVDAQVLMEGLQSSQEKLQKLQMAGLQPSEEQVQEFQQQREQMSTNSAISSFMQAQEEFSNMVQEVNEAISEGMKDEDEDDATV